MQILLKKQQQQESFFAIPAEESTLHGLLVLEKNLLYSLPNLPSFNFARVERLELPTPGFGDQCSTN